MKTPKTPILMLTTTIVLLQTAVAQTQIPAQCGLFPQEIARSFSIADGLPDEDILALAFAPDGTLFAATSKGLARYSENVWEAADGAHERFNLLWHDGNVLWALDDAGLARMDASGAVERVDFESFPPFAPFLADLAKVKSLTTFAFTASNAAASLGGRLFIADGGQCAEQFPANGNRSWLPRDVRGAAFDSLGRLWYASPQGVGCRDDDGGWTLYTTEDGVPCDDFTCVAAGGDGAVWFGTTKGAIRFDGQSWNYRQGRGWLPHDRVRAIAVDAQGNAWFATPKGVGLIERRPMSLREKAAFYEDEIDKYHRRTPYGYVLEVALEAAGDKSAWEQSDSDNDGLWTSMYGAGECFAYAVTGDPIAKKRAKNAFEALRFLSVVTQDGNPPALPGFVARSILPTDGWNPNEEAYTREKDVETRKSDALWKVLYPRWPVSADGKWYWKCDTSSDELDGHYFFYAAYYDLVADTDAEKQRVRDVVTAISDHLVEHDFCLVDWDGTPTRWAVYSPGEINHNPAWLQERGLNSLSILSYLAAAEHIVGTGKYREAFDRLVRDHGYAMNLIYSKLQFGPGSNNQSDDEMAFMSYYNLIKYCPDPAIRSLVAYSFKMYWELERFELNPFFNFAYAGVCTGLPYSDQWGTLDLTPKGPWLEQSLDTLQRFPLDRCDWRHLNSHRKDIVPLPAYRREGNDAQGKGSLRNGYVLPVDERHFNHWNCDPWDLDQGGDGRTLSTGTVFLLPYYMGLHHRFLIEKE